MKISVLCSDSEHPIWPRLKAWCETRRAAHSVELVNSTVRLTGGELLFLISCTEIVNTAVRSRYRSTLVIHASDLPDGRGWSPLVWQIVEGRNDITVTLLEAEDKVDTGAIWQQFQLHFAGHELVDEINAALFDAESALMDFAVDHFETVVPQPQDDRQATYYRRRTSEDSRIDPRRSIDEQFNLLRVADPRRYPAFFEYLGQRYEIVLRKAG